MSATLLVDEALPQAQREVPSAKMEFHSTGFRYHPCLIHDVPSVLYTETELSGENKAFLSKMLKVKLVDATDTKRVVCASPFKSSPP